MTTYNKRPVWSGFVSFVLLALVACTAGPATPETLTPSLTPQPNMTFFPMSTPEPIETNQIMRVFTPVATNTPWIFSSFCGDAIGNGNRSIRGNKSLDGNF
jgi:hypothetical protein